eukprot:3246296-Pyramimonas_sp.AAC.1
MVFHPKVWYWERKGFTKETANQLDKCCAKYPVAFHKYPDLRAWLETYEGEGATLPSGDFDTERLEMQEILKAHDRVDEGKSTVPSTSITR